MEIIVRIIRKDRSLMRPQRYCTIVELKVFISITYKTRLITIVIGANTIVALDIADFITIAVFRSSIIIRPSILLEEN